MNKYVCCRHATCKNNVAFPNYKRNNIMYQANKYSKSLCMYLNKLLKISIRDIQLLHKLSATLIIKSERPRAPSDCERHRLPTKLIKCDDQQNWFNPLRLIAVLRKGRPLIP